MLFRSHADRLYQLPLGVVGVAIGVVLLPELSRALKAGNFREAEHNQLEHLLHDFPMLRAIAFNGLTAARIGRGLIGQPPGQIALLDLPSSSAANTRPFAEKAEAWSRLAQFCGPAQSEVS